MRTPFHSIGDVAAGLLAPFPASCSPGLRTRPPPPSVRCIHGDSPKTVLITARGPSLAPFGIANALESAILITLNPGA